MIQNRFLKIKEILKTAKDDELILDKLKYSRKDLDPVLSEDSMNYHYGKLAAGYVKRYNNKEGDKDFNKAGAFLHNIFFKQFRSPKQSNKPNGKILNIINNKFGSFEDFKNKMLEEAIKIQGSGWIYLSKNGDIKVIKNHQERNDIAMLIDWWEHAWALDYQHDKEKYMNNIWKIIDWDFINNKIGD